MVSSETISISGVIFAIAVCKILSTARSPLETGVLSGLVNIFSFEPESAMDFLPAFTKAGISFRTMPL